MTQPFGMMSVVCIMKCCCVKQKKRGWLTVYNGIKDGRWPYFGPSGEGKASRPLIRDAEMV
jgi:hypothetical protein